MENLRTDILPYRKITCFTAYDLRGVVSENIDEDIAYRVGRSCVEVLRADTLVVGYDARASSFSIASALTHGIRDAGAGVIDIKLAGSEEVYNATSYFKACGGISYSFS